MSLPTPGTKETLLRHLRHLRAPGRGAKSGKFKNKGVPTQAMSRPAYVHHYDRIAYWNIVPGDFVALRRGRKVFKEDKTWTKGEGQVVSIDRETNKAYLDNQTNPEFNTAVAIKHIVPRLIEPDKGAASQLTATTAIVAKPVHYSNLMLRLPETTVLPEDSPFKKADLQAGIYAKRLERGNVSWNRANHAFKWDRFAVVRAPDGQTLRLKVPWPKVQVPERRMGPAMADSSVVALETWIPWAANDPIHLPARRARTSPHSEARFAKDMAHHIATASTRSNRVEGYAQFIPKRLGPPPIAQAPTPAEEVWVKRRQQEAWASSPSVKQHLERAGNSFAANDYLTIAPAEGPMRHGAWDGLPITTPIGAGERNALGERQGEAGSDEVDSWPIELLMQRELAPENTLAKRMRRWKLKQEEKKLANLALAKQLRANVKTFQKMTL